MAARKGPRCRSPEARVPLSQVSRLEGQVLRYKAAAENAEKVEDELKAEKRKLQREVAAFACPERSRAAGGVEPWVPPRGTAVESLTPPCRFLTHTVTAICFTLVD